MSLLNLYARDVADSLSDEKPERPDLAIANAGYPHEEDAAEEDYCAYTKAFVDEQEPGMEHLFNTWIQNLLFLAGLQWHRRNAARGTWEREKAPKWREFPVTNLTIPFFKHYLAKLTKNRPGWSAIGASTDPEDVHSAKLAEDALEAKWTELRMGRVMRRALAWLIPTGNSYLQPYWNERTGRMVPVTIPMEVDKVDGETGEVVGREVIECPCDENGNPHVHPEDGSLNLDVEPIYVDEGDVATRVLSPFQVFVDASAESDDDVETVVIVEPVAVRDLKRQYPHKADFIHAEDIGMLETFDRLLSGTIAGADTHMSAGHATRDNEIGKALKYHHHEKPRPEYPGGRYWTCTSSCLLDEPDILPEQIWPPVVHMVDIETPGRYHGTSTFESVVGLNREYNELNGMIKEHHNLLLRGKWLVPIGSNIRKGQITSQPGEVIQHTPGLAPVQADLKPLPQQVYLERDRILKDYQLVSGIAKVSMGDVPTGVTAASAFLVLQEADDTDLGPALAMFEESVAELAWKFIQIMQQRYDEERLITITGKDKSFQVRMFKGADLQGVVAVVPQYGSSAPWSQTARQAFLLDVIKQVPTLFQDDDTGMLDRGKIARLLPIAGLESLTQFEDIDVNEAMREEEEFEGFMLPADQVPTPMPWQNHEIHDRQHTRVLKSAGFKQWAPEAQTAFIKHWLQTRAFRDAARAQKAQMMAIANGAQPTTENNDSAPSDGAQENE